MVIINVKISFLSQMRTSTGKLKLCPNLSNFLVERNKSISSWNYLAVSAMAIEPHFQSLVSKCDPFKSEPLPQGN